MTVNGSQLVLKCWLDNRRYLNPSLCALGNYDEYFLQYFDILQTKQLIPPPHPPSLALCQREMQQRSHDKALNFPNYVSVFLELALWEGSVGMERSIGMLIFQAICYSEEAAKVPPTPHPSFLLCCTSLWPCSLQETGAGPSHHLSSIQASVVFFPLEMSLGSVGTLIEFVGYEVALRSYFLTGSLILGSLLGNPAAVFESGIIAEREKWEQWPVDCLLFTVIFHWAPSFLCHSLVYHQAANKMILFPLHSGLLFLVFKQITAGKLSNLQLVVCSIRVTLGFFLHDKFHKFQKNENSKQERACCFLSFQLTLTCKDSKTVLLHWCGRTCSKKRNNICPLNWCYCVSTAVRCYDCVASSQQLYFYEHSQWKAHLCFFPGSGDSFLLAGSKNR